MGVAKKNRRKFAYHDQVFYWDVKEDPDEDYKILLIVSDDKKFIIHYRLLQDNPNNLLVPKYPYITVLGKTFKGRNDVGSCHKRFVVPKWEDTIVTPKLIEMILEWCFLEGEVAEVDYKGELLTNVQ
ncbi:hypothetical protein RHO13_00550 [Orbus wheelerorum]|uniref:hypothetical protein n=1 Tax=Orbus wheelerorum TaxID=3074111 RepID=UPI00370D2F80